MGKKKTIDDIFDDDEFGLLDAKAKSTNVKTEEDRLIDSFEQVNLFYDKHDREPSKTSMSEYGLLAKLNNFKENEEQKKILKPFDRHNLLGHVELDTPSLDDILDEDDELGLLDTDEDLSIFKYKHTPKQDARAASDFVAQRKAMSEDDFEPYEDRFQQVHKEIKEGKRKIKPFRNAEKNLKVGHFYLLDGLLLYLEEADLIIEEVELKSGNRKRSEGRTKTVFENATISNMLFRSLGKAIIANGKLVTQSASTNDEELFVNTGMVNEEDLETGWVYILKSLSKDKSISSIDNLYKIGFSKTHVDERIKNAQNEATYLYADVAKVASYRCYNWNADKLERLLHRFFANVCLDIDLIDSKGKRLNPREWFVVPFPIIEEAIQLMWNDSILKYEYDTNKQEIKLKDSA